MKHTIQIDHLFLQKAYARLNSCKKMENFSELTTLSSMLGFFEQKCTVMLTRGQLNQLKNTIKNSPQLKRMIDPNNHSSPLKVVEKPEFPNIDPNVNPMLLPPEELAEYQYFILKEKPTIEDKNYACSASSIMMDFDAFTSQWQKLSQIEQKFIHNKQALRLTELFENLHIHSRSVLLIDNYVCSGKGGDRFNNLFEIIKAFSTTNSNQLHFILITRHPDSNIEEDCRELKKVILKSVYQYFPNIQFQAKVLPKGTKTHDRHLLTQFFDLEIIAGFDLIKNGKSKHATTFKAASIVADRDNYEKHRSWARKLFFGGQD